MPQAFFCSHNAPMAQAFFVVWHASWGHSAELQACDNSSPLRNLNVSLFFLGMDAVVAAVLPGIWIYTYACNYMLAYLINMCHQRISGHLLPPDPFYRGCSCCSFVWSISWNVFRECYQQFSLIFYYFLFVPWLVTTNNKQHTTNNNKQQQTTRNMFDKFSDSRNFQLFSCFQFIKFPSIRFSFIFCEGKGRGGTWAPR